ncbi:cytokinin riboside 5'-monophosphate phosphoribohydrolase [Polymorphobacter multimanifer]|nr:TIGR00730 family Rossman fold protein [Polymorphobacter multimanifer]GGI84374.1 cytokinin riboside 5'-monophosphate phosphoribohydrolase [Polymorphobacter multimanifer]
MIQSLLLFCGSRPGHDPAHAALAAELGTLLAVRGVTLVYGGGAVGLMGIAARASMAAGGRVVGIIPRLLMTSEIAQAGLAEMLVVETLHERKALMHARADAILAIPGSIGTLDELFESLTWRELGIHDKPIWLLGDNGYWAPLTTLLGHIAAEGFAPPDLDRLAQPLPGLAALDRLLLHPHALPA